MFKVLGALFGAGVAVSLGSMLLVPFIVLSLLAFFGETLGHWWPFLLGLLVYTAVVAVVTALLPSLPAKGWAVAGGGTLATIVVIAGRGWGWTTSFVALFVVITVVGTSLTALSSSSEALHEETHPETTHPRRWSPPKDDSVEKAVTKAGEMGQLILVQNLWAAPTALMFLTYPNVLALIAALLGVIATFFAVDALDLM